MHSEQTTAVLTASEPPDGTVLVLRMESSWRTIIRDDSAAAEWGAHAHPDDHWFEADPDADSEPMSLHRHVKDADAVYALGDKLAEFK